MALRPLTWDGVRPHGSPDWVQGVFLSLDGIASSG